MPSAKYSTPYNQMKSLPFAKLTWQFKNNVQDHKGRREVQLPINLIDCS